VVGTTVYLPCPTGPVAVTVTASPAALTVQWTSRVGGGPPIVAAGLVWTIGLDGTLYGLDPSSGSVRQQVSIGVPANHFPTPSVGDGLLLAPTSNRVVAFTATPTTSTPTTSAPTTSAPTTSAPSTTNTVPRSNAAGASGSSSGGGTSPGEIAGIVAAGVLVLGGAGWVLLRRRRRGAGP